MALYKIRFDNLIRSFQFPLLISFSGIPQQNENECLRGELSEKKRFYAGDDTHFIVYELIYQLYSNLLNTLAQQGLFTTL